MDPERSYTIDEIERETGFDKRTIAYYVQEGLLPRVGRRGPRTRYPQSYLDRLLLIRMIRRLQDQGRLGNLSLRDIGNYLAETSEERISDVVRGRAPLTFEAGIAPEGPEESAIAPPRRRRESMRRLSSPAYASDKSPANVGPQLSSDRRADDEAEAPEGDDGALMLDLDAGPPELELRRVDGDPGAVEFARAEPPPPPAAAEPTIGGLLRRLDRVAGRGPRGGRRSSEHWTRAEVTPDIAITARGLDGEHAPLLESVAKMLRAEILHRRGEYD
jgi:DNA-binding transcriptional MerR regulator